MNKQKYVSLKFLEIETYHSSQRNFSWIRMSHALSSRPPYTFMTCCLNTIIYSDTLTTNQLCSFVFSLLMFSLLLMIYILQYEAAASAMSRTVRHWNKRHRIADVGETSDWRSRHVCTQPPPPSYTVATSRLIWGYEVPICRVFDRK
jgi:hypothetical protein